MYTIIHFKRHAATDQSISYTVKSTYMLFVCLYQNMPPMVRYDKVLNVVNHAEEHIGWGEFIARES